MTREEIAAYVVAIEADTTKYKKGIQQASEDTKRVADQMRKHAEGAEVFGKVIDNLGTKMSNMAGQFRAMAAIESPFGFVKHGVSLGAEAEQMEISFGTMLRSADKGRELVKDLQKFAADTPMTLQGLQQNAKMLLQFGVSGSQIIPTLQKLGDVTGGDADKMARMTLGFGQMMSAGRVLGEELNQMREAGFNPLLTLAEDMAKKFGGPVSEHMATLQTQLAAGAIKVSDVERAFKIATSEGGQFFGLMQKQSQSFNGLMSTMHDDVDALKRSVGKSVIELFYLKDGLKAVSDAAQDLTKRYDELSNRQKELVSSVAILVLGFGALIVTWKVGAIASGMVIGVLKDMVITFGSVTAGIRAHVAAMGVMGTTIAALKLGIIGLSGVIVVMGAKALVKLSEDANGTTEALRKLNDERERGAKLNSDLAGSALYNPHRQILKEASEYRTELERWKFIASKSGEVEKQLQEANKAVENTQAGIDRLLDTPARKARGEIKQFAKAGRFGEQNSPLAVAAGTFFGEGALTDSQEVELKSRRDQLASQKGIVDALKASKAELDKAKQGTEPKYDAGHVKELADSVDALQKSGALAADSFQTWGDTTERAQQRLERLRLENLYVSRSMLWIYDAAYKVAEAYKHQARQREELQQSQKRATEDASEYARTLRDENATLLMTTSQAKLYTLQHDRAFSSIGDHSGMMKEYVEMLAKESERLNRVKSIMEAGKATTDSVATPLEKYETQLHSLVDQLNTGAISQETFNRAMVEAQKAAAGANAEIQKLDGTLANSAEGRSRVRNYVQSLRDPTGLGPSVEASNRKVVEGFGFAPNAKETVGLFTQMRDYLASIAGREPSIELAEAAVTGR